MTQRLILPNEKELRVISSVLPTLMWVSDVNKQAYFFSQGWLEFTGRQHHDEVGTGWQAGFHPEDLPEFTSQYNASFDSQKEFKLRCRVKRYDGKYRWLAIHGIPGYSPEGNFAGYIFSTTDIHEFVSSETKKYDAAVEQSLYKEQELNEELASTNEEIHATNEELLATNEELQRSEENLARLNRDLEKKVADRTRSLEESQHRTRTIIETAPFPIGVYVGKEMRIEFANKAITDVWGKGVDVIGKLYSDILPELQNQEIFSQLDKVYTTGVPFHAKNQRVDLVVGGELTPFYFNYSFTALRDHDGEIYGVMNTAADITEIVKAKAAVDHQQQKLYNMILQAPVAMCLLSGPDHVITLANELMIELWGKGTKAVIQKPVFEALPDARSQGLEELLAEVYRTGKAFRAHEQAVSLIRYGNPEVVYQNFVYEPYKDIDGNIIGIIAIMIDVTEQVLSRKLLEKSYEEQQAISEELAAGNEEMASMNEELTAINDDLVESQERLARSEKLFKSIALNIPDSLVIVVDKDQKFLAIEGDLMQKMGYNSTDFIGKHPKDVTPPERYEASRELYERVLAGERLSVERKSAMGDDFIVHLVPLIDDDDEVYAGLIIALDITRIKSAEIQSAKLAAIVHTSNDAIVSKTLEGIITSWNKSAERIFGYSEEEMIGESILKIIPEDRLEEEPAIISRMKLGERVEHFETRRKRKDGSLIDVSLSISPIIDSGGNIIGVSKIARDISEKKQEENRKNDFIGMVSHELKTPLTSLTALVQVLDMKLKNSSDSFVRGAAEKAAIQVRKMATMINGFLNVSRLESGQLLLEKRHFDLKNLIIEVISETQLVNPWADIALVSTEKLNVFADPEKISSVISNLLGNAIKYSERGSRITIAYKQVGDSVQVGVEDPGMGISERDIDRLFERYYRVETTDTKHISGFGIGLYLSSEIVKGHGGKIWAESELQKGSTFFFTIPLFSEANTI